MHKHKSMPYESKSGTTYVIRNNAHRLAKTPNKINSGKKLKKRVKAKQQMPLHPRHIAPQIDALDTQSRSSIPPIPVIPSTHHSLDHIVRVRNAKPMHLAPRHASDSPTNHTKCTTFEYDYDCDLEPVPGPARIQPFALTEENIERLNTCDDVG
eukprot:379921_1